MMPILPKTPITVIIPCRNEIGHIGKFLDCLSAQDFSGLQPEILIADGRSDDGTREFAETYSQANPAVCIVDNPEGIVSTGLNRSIRRARGAIILRMDVHSEYAPDYILRCIEVLRETGADNVGGPALATACGFVPEAIAIAYQSKFSCGGAQFHDRGYEGYVDTVTYGCWRREVFDRIGLFDEALLRNQDDEFNLRLTRAGGRIWQSRKPISWYHPRTSLSSLFHQYFQYGFWKVAVIRKHRVPASWRHLVPVAFVLVTLFLPPGILAISIAGAKPLSAMLSRVWLLSTSLYILASLSASVSAARQRGWKYLSLLPAVFATFHLSYGIGFLLGLFKLTKWLPILRLRNAVSDITR